MHQVHKEDPARKQAKGISIPFSIVSVAQMNMVSLWVEASQSWTMVIHPQQVCFGAQLRRLVLITHFQDAKVWENLQVAQTKVWATALLCLHYFVLKEVKKYLFNCSTLLSILAFRYQLGNLQQLGLCEIALPFIHSCTSEGPVRREALATNSKQWIWQVDVLPTMMVGNRSYFSLDQSAPDWILSSIRNN